MECVFHPGRTRNYVIESKQAAVVISISQSPSEKFALQYMKPIFSLINNISHTKCIQNMYLTNHFSSQQFKKY